MSPDTTETETETEREDDDYYGPHEDFLEYDGGSEAEGATEDLSEVTPAEPIHDIVAIKGYSNGDVVVQCRDCGYVRTVSLPGECFDAAETEDH